MKRWWAGLCVVVVVLVSCADSEPAAVEGRYGSVRELVAVLEEDGIRCTNLSVQDKDELEDERGAEPEPTPPPGGIRIEGPELDVREIGVCQFEGSPAVAGEMIGSKLIVYGDDEHLETIPERGYPGMALVYGDNWLVQLSHVEIADRVAASLEGEVVAAADLPREDPGAAEAAPQCFLIAALPPGLEAAAEEVGLPTADPGRFAELFGEAVYYLPDEVRRARTESCKRGLEMAGAIRADDDVLLTDAFERFWLELCAHSGFDPLVHQELGIGGTFSFEGVGKRLTERFLKKTSLDPRARKDLGRRCGDAATEAMSPPG